MLNLMICIFVWILGFVQSKTCYKNSRNGVTESWFCCNNHEEKHGVCVECEIGYVSKDGFPCEQCLPGRWGRKCRNKCICQHNERCDIGYGCVAVTTVMPGIVSTQSQRWESTKQKESTDVKTTDSISTTDKNDGILLNCEIVIYSISAGSIAVIVTLASCCLKYKRKAEHLYHSRSPRTHHQQLSSERENVQYNRNNESAYDLIDEENMMADATLIRSELRGERAIQARSIHSVIVDQDGSSSSNSAEYVNNPDEVGYLNPYQPMIEVDHHGYRTLADEKDAESSICSTIQDNEHVPPNQSMKPFVDEHMFSPIDEDISNYTTNARSISDTNTGDIGSCIADADQTMPLEQGPPFTIESEVVKNQDEKESFLEEKKCKNDDTSSSSVINGSHETRPN